MLLIGAGALALGAAQPAAQGPAFEVVSIKPHELPPNQFVIRIPKAPGPPEPNFQGNRFHENLISLQDLLTQAYGVYSFQLAGLPDWASSDHFDIDARSGGDAVPTTAQMRMMLQRAIVDRFQLQFHRESRPIPVYELIVKDGRKIREITKEEFDNQPHYSRLPERFPDVSMTTMVSFAHSLQMRVDRPVLDETKLSGYYEIPTPEWMQPDHARGTDAVERQAEVFSEIESRDGLKLEPRNDAFEVLVIDHVERPSPN
ncbi:MAG TPA: TIGR03435 family protein [Bryobacteraceae bacterium]|nr:TIGR03435 family protein [Bryobacteraceae bacterium]